MYILILHIFFMVSTVALVTSAAMIARGRKAGWFVRHRRLAEAGSISALVGFTAEFSFKAVMHYPHFMSPHAIAGAIAVALLVVTPVIGARVASNPGTFGQIHRAFGRATALIVTVTGLMGIARFVQLVMK